MFNTITSPSWNLESMDFSFLFASLLFLLLKLNRNRRWAAHGPLSPGPWKLPILGGVHHLRGRLNHQSLAALAQRFGSVMLLHLGEVPTLVLSSAKATSEIIRAQDICFATRPLLQSIKILSYGGKGIVFAPYGIYWRELRKISILELLSAKGCNPFARSGRRRHESSCGRLRSRKR